MGIAEVIPGVSGGTIAFITGIYETLLDSIKGLLGTGVWTSLQRQGVAAAWERVNGNFLLLLGAGMVTGLIGGVFGVTALLDRYPPVIWAFFFGLIIASAIYIGRQVGRWTVIEGVMLIVGLGVAYLLTVVNPLSGSENLLAVFFSGMVAICALVLPGISGSFVLLLLGMYPLVLGSVRDLLSSPDAASATIVGIFALGCLAGLAGFSRLLSWTLRRFPHPTMALLTGFMIGSLNKLWPWRNVLTYRVDSEGVPVPLLEENVLPGQYDGEPYVLAVTVAILLGFALVFALEYLGRGAARDATIEDEASHVARTGRP